MFCRKKYLETLHEVNELIKEIEMTTAKMNTAKTNLEKLFIENHELRHAYLKLGKLVYKHKIGLNK